MLGALADNGGPTETMLPQPGSPLIDAIQPISECQVDVDQRGVDRPQIKGCDTGAVEVLVRASASTRWSPARSTTRSRPDGYSTAASCTDGTSATLTVANRPRVARPTHLADILPGAVCTVTESPVNYTNPNVAVQPIVTYDPVTGSPLGEGEHRGRDGHEQLRRGHLLGIAVNIVPKFTG